MPAPCAGSLREIVAGEVRAGVAAAGRERWSTEPMSKMIEKFLEAQCPAGEGKNKNKHRKVGSKHRKDVAQRLAALLLFTGDKAVSDVTRDDLKNYRDILDQVPDRLFLELESRPGRHHQPAKAYRGSR
jgi:hypothetical protein